jgi:hypothetical protein
VKGEEEEEEEEAVLTQRLHASRGDVHPSLRERENAWLLARLAQLEQLEPVLRFFARLA